jgi:hypothetical protein
LLVRNGFLAEESLPKRCSVDQLLYLSSWMNGRAQLKAELSLLVAIIIKGHLT